MLTRKKLNIRHFIRVSIVCLFSLQTPKIIADEIKPLSTLDVVQNTLQALPNCFRYKIVGLCFWLKCVGSFCSINTTPKVDHYLPDAVVSVFQKQNSNPWDYANNMIDKVAFPFGNSAIKHALDVDIGYGNKSASTVHDGDTLAKEADLIGNPALKFFSNFRQYVLPSQATPFIPYYISFIDSYMWRSPLYETLLYPHTLIPGVHIVGSLMNNWGSVYPRTGMLMQPQDTKAAAVMAQRAADIATRSMQPHVYNPLIGPCGSHCEINEVTENDDHSEWQMIFPAVEKNCKVFGENDLSSKPWGSDNAQKGNGNYAWALWRRYHGCIEGEGKYIGSIDF